MQKIVLTGGPCSGKSTLIEHFKSQGYNVLEEIARQVIEKRKQFEPTREEWRIRQHMILTKQILKELELKGEKVFLDRGVYDNFAYYKHLVGGECELTLPNNFQKYDKVFCLEQLPFVHDGLRIESGEEEGKKIHRMIVDEYKREGYKLIHVPVLPVEERGEYILGGVL